MNIVLDKLDYSISNVYFNDPVKNSIIENSKFIRIIYSTDIIIMNGIYIKMDINKPVRVTDFINTIPKLIFTLETNESLINYIRQIEIDILNKVNIQTKRKTYKLLDYFVTGYLKHINYSFILKISGIWETENEYGLTFKII